MAQDFTLRPFDRVRITSTGTTSLASDQVLGESGSIAFGTGIRIFLAGRTLAEAAVEIGRSIGPSTGRVGIELVDANGGSVTFRGAVKRGGSLQLVAPRTIADILAVAEPTDAADLTGIIVVSSMGKTFRVDADVMPDFGLRPGDQILIPQLSVPNDVMVLGAVKNPGTFAFRAGLTMEQAVALAGGLTGHAVVGEVTVVRREQVVREIVWTEAGRSSKLQRGDIVRVGGVENGRYVSVLGHIKTPGLVPFKPGMTLMELIEAAGGITVGAGKDAVEIRKVFASQGRTRRYDLNLIRKGSPNDPKLQAADVVFVPAFAFKEPRRSNSGFRPVVPPLRSR